MSKKTIARKLTIHLEYEGDSEGAAQVLGALGSAIAGLLSEPTKYWDIISRHRSQKAAIAACERHARKALRKPASTK